MPKVEDLLSVSFPLVDVPPHLTVLVENQEKATVESCVDALSDYVVSLLKTCIACVTKSNEELKLLVDFHNPFL